MLSLFAHPPCRPSLWLYDLSSSVLVTVSPRRDPLVISALPLFQPAIDEDALDLTETIDINGPSKHVETDTVDKDTGYELHPLPSYFADRARRPSAVRVDSDATMTFKDAIEPPTPVAEDVCKSIYTAPALPMAAIPNIHVRAQQPEMTKRQKRYSLIHFAALCWCFLMQGWNDGATGPLLPRMQEYYHVRFVSSLSFQEAV